MIPDPELEPGSARLCVEGSPLGHPLPYQRAFHDHATCDAITYYVASVTCTAPGDAHCTDILVHTVATTSTSALAHCTLHTYTARNLASKIKGRKRLQLLYYKVLGRDKWRTVCVFDLSFEKSVKPR